MRGIVTIALFTLWAVAAMAQDSSDDDKGFLTRLIEDNLSGVGRSVEITGFTGALSSEARIARLTVADDTGVWLTLDGLVMTWDRSALLSGRIDIATLNAAQITMSRTPVAAPSQPGYEATPFSLPTLPVSLDIGTLQADRILLGAAVLGDPVELTLGGRVNLADGQGDTQLSAARIDGAQGTLEMRGTFDNTSRELTLGLSLDEGADGIAARLMRLPDRPALSLTISGTGPLDSFAATMALGTDGQERLTGHFSRRLTAEGEAPAKIDYLINLSGDVTRLFAPDYRAFFGSQISLRGALSQQADGSIALEALDIDSAAARLHGKAVLDANYWPRRFDVTGQLGGGETPVLLPIGGPPTRVASADLRLVFDAAAGEAWQLSLDARGMTRPGVAVDRLSFAGGGTIRPGDGIAGGAFTALVDYAARGVRFDDAGLGDAMGDVMTGQIDVRRDAGAATRIEALTLRGPGLFIDASGAIDTEETGFAISAALRLRAEALARFSTLAGRPLSGSADLTVASSYHTSSAAFSAFVTGTTTDLSVGIPRLDPLLRGASDLSVLAERDQNGTRLRGLNLLTDAVELEGEFAVSSAAIDGWLDVALADIGLIEPTLFGPAHAAATVRRTGTDKLRIAGSAGGPGGATLALDGTVDDDQNLDATLRGQLPLGLINNLIEPRRLDGTATLDLTVRGPLALSSLGGTIATSGARVSAPTLGQSAEAVDATLQLGDGQAALTLHGNTEGGGGVTVDGNFGLAAPYEGNLDATITKLILRDPALYETSLSGEVGLRGPLAGGAMISGQLALGETIVQVPSSAVGLLGELPEVRHVNAPASVIATLARAGATTSGAAPDSGDRAVYGLDLRLSAPSRIFVRGRGLDAELGGELTLTGTTANVVPLGEFGLIRGRLNILQQRFELTEGAATITGDFLARIRLVATTKARSGTVVNVTLEGPIDAPEVSFSSVPDLPQDEVLAQLIFGRDLSHLSALQAVQLGAALNTLAGRGNGGWSKTCGRVSALTTLT